MHLTQEDIVKLATTPIGHSVVLSNRYKVVVKKIPDPTNKSLKDEKTRIFTPCLRCHLRAACISHNEHAKGLDLIKLGKACLGKYRLDGKSVIFVGV